MGDELMNATPKPAAAEPVAHEAPAKRSLLDEIVDENRIAQARYLPVMSAKMAVARRNSIQELVNLVLVEGEDYGVIPGTESKDPNKPSKKVLLKPGAEKICAYFGYVPSYEVIEGSIEDWTGQRFGEPLFYYHITCNLTRDGAAVGSGSGSCSTWERKYRYRTSKRSCPSCGQQLLIKGKPEYERDAEYKRRGAWICYEKKGGCGAKYFGDDPEIMDQPLGDVPNPDFADIINTVRKMADKRAYIAATLSATGASQWFTQDLEDLQPEPENHQQNTKAEQKELAERRMIEERSKVAEMPLTFEAKMVLEYDKAQGFDKFNLFDQIETKVFPPIFGDRSGVSYQAILTKYGVEKPNQFKTQKPARACFVELLQLANNEAKRQEIERRNAPAEPPPSEPFEAIDEDLPMEMGGRAPAPSLVEDKKGSPRAATLSEINKIITEIGKEAWFRIMGNCGYETTAQIPSETIAKTVLGMMKGMIK